MTGIAQDQLQQIKDQLYALQQLVLSHVAAAIKTDPDMRDFIFDHARTQERALMVDRPYAAVRLNALIESLDEVTSQTFD